MSETKRDPEIQALLDKQAINEVLVSYCRGADRGDADLIAAAYHTGAIEDHGGTFLGTGEEYVAMLREVFPTAPRMTHLITNIAIELEGPDKALTECYFLAFSRREENGEPFDHLSCCRAVDKFEKRDGKWAIAHRRMCWEWGHEMETKETWSRGQTAPDPSALVRGGKKPNDILYEMGG